MRRLRHLLCILALFSTGLTTAMFGQGAPITDDAYVSSATPTANNGTSPSLVVQNPGGFSYIRFDLARVLPPNTSPYPIAASMVAKATLKVYASAVTAGGNVDIYQVAGPWCEKTGGTCAAGIHNQVGREGCLAGRVPVGHTNAGHSLVKRATEQSQNPMTL